MKFYKSTAGCGHKQYAYVTPISANDYLCIWTNENSNMPIHVEGEVVENLENIYLEEVEININDYPICRTFLFQFFMKKFEFENP